MICSTTVSQSGPSLGTTTTNSELAAGGNRTGLIVGVFGGVLSFWVLGGLALWQLRRMRRSQMRLVKQVDMGSLDMAQSQIKSAGQADAPGVSTTRTDVQAAAGTNVQRSLVGTTRTTTSASSYAPTFDWPAQNHANPTEPVPLLPANLAGAAAVGYNGNPFNDPQHVSRPPHSHPHPQPLTIATSIETPASAEPLTKWERELKLAQAAKEGVNRATSSKRSHVKDETSAGVSSAGGTSAPSASTTAPPLYTPSTAQYANGVPRNWV